MASKSVESQIIADIKDFNVSIHHCINHKIPEKDPDLEEPVYDFYTDIELIL